MIPTKQRPSAPRQVNASGPDVERQQTSGGNRRLWLYIVVAVCVAAIAGAIVFFIKKDKEPYPDSEIYDVVAYDDSVQELLSEEELLNEAEPVEVEEVTAEEILAVDEADAVAPAEEVVNAVDGTEDVNVDRGYRSDVVEEEAAPAVDDTKVFTSVDQLPRFPGGESKLLEWIYSHIQYPAAAQEKGVQGRVVIQFVIKDDGTIGDVIVARGKDPDLDKEAVRVVKTLPKFIPGKVNGKAVDVWYSLPIVFKLQKYIYK